MLRSLILPIILCFCSTPALADNLGPGGGERTAEAQLALDTQWGPYAPKGWRVLMIATGSIFGPQTDDAALVVEDQDPANFVSNEGMGVPKINTNRRWLLLLSGQQGVYEIRGQIEDFVPSEGDAESPCLADPLMEGPGIEIKNRVLSIGLQYWYSCGSWYVNRNTFKFRAEKERLQLIGQESWSFHRASGMGSRTSVNYLTGRKKHVDNVRDIGPEPQLADGEELPKLVTKWTNVKRGPHYLDEMDRAACDNFERAPSWCGY